jgi:hypothetical protein
VANVFGNSEFRFQPGQTVILWHPMHEDRDERVTVEWRSRSMGVPTYTVRHASGKVTRLVSQGRLFLPDGSDPTPHVPQPKAIDDGTRIQCACGCGLLVRPRDRFGKPREYAFGHRPRQGAAR